MLASVVADNATNITEKRANEDEEVLLRQSLSQAAAEAADIVV